MKNEEIEIMLNSGLVRKRSPDKFRAESLIKAAIVSAEFAKLYEIDDKTATGIFKEMYDAFRQLGDAKWSIMGYEPVDSHKASMKALATAEIKMGYRLQNIDMFRVIRNDVQYRGYLVKKEQASDIVSLWDDLSKELIEWVKK